MTSSSERPIWIALFSGAVLPLVLVYPAAGETQATKSQIAAAWKQRQERIVSADIQWTETRLMARSHERAVDPFAPPPAATAEDFDLPTVEHVYKQQFAFSGRRYRFLDSEPAWSLTNREYIVRDADYAFDGLTLMQLTKQHRPEGFQYQGLLASTEEVGGARSRVCLKPLLLHFQPLYDDGQRLENYEVQPHSAPIGETLCVVIQRKKNSFGPVKETMWLDPSLGFAVRRFVRESNGRTIAQLDIEYSNDSEFGPLPKRWKRISYLPNGAFDRSIEANVTALKINYAPDENEFRIEFPEETIVIDRRTSADPEFFVTRPDGEKRIVLKEELTRAKSADEIIRTETGRAGLADDRPSGLWLWIAVSLMVCFLSLVVAWSAYRRRSC